MVIDSPTRKVLRARCLFNFSKETLQSATALSFYPALNPETPKTGNKT
jgi:hypothetical protein